jgi:hypothetical protein
MSLGGLRRNETSSEVSHNAVCGESQQTPVLRRDFLIRETVILTFIPALAYGVAYCFALGRASQFGIPSQLISVGVSDILRALGAIIAPVGIVYLLLQLLLDMIPSDRWKSVSKALSRKLMVISLVTVFLVAAQAGVKWWLIFLGGLILLDVAFPLLGAFISKDKDADIASRINSAFAHNQPRDALNDLFDWIGKPSIGVTITVVLTLALSGLAGYGSASRQVVFLEQPRTSEVLVAIYGNNYLFESIDARQLTGRFTIVSESQAAHLILNTRSLGPLNTPRICALNTC